LVKEELHTEEDVNHCSCTTWPGVVGDDTRMVVA
jgi:hypothetical protein